MKLQGLILGIGLLLVQGAYASKGMTVSDLILKDYRDAKNFKTFVEKLVRGSAWDDQKYIEQIFAKNPNFEKDTSLPTLTLNEGVFTVRVGVSEAKITLKEEQLYINGEKMKFSRLDYPSRKMKMISLRVANQKAVSFVLLPVAWAQTKGTPSKLTTTLYALSEALHSGRGKNLSPSSLAALKAVESMNPLCAKKQQALETAIAQEGFELQASGCDKGRVVLSFGADSDGNARRLEMAPDGFTEVLTLGKRERRFSYDFVKVDPREGGSTEAIGAELPVSMTLSPFQREALGGGEFKAATSDEFSEERLHKYIGIVANQEFRALCLEENKCSAVVEQRWKKAQEIEKATSAPQSGAR